MLRARWSDNYEAIFYGVMSSNHPELMTPYPQPMLDFMPQASPASLLPQSTRAVALPLPLHLAPPRPSPARFSVWSHSPRSTPDSVAQGALLHTALVIVACLPGVKHTPYSAQARKYAAAKSQLALNITCGGPSGPHA